MLIVLQQWQSIDAYDGIGGGNSFIIIPGATDHRGSEPASRLLDSSQFLLTERRIIQPVTGSFFEFSVISTSRLLAVVYFLDRTVTNQ